MSDIIYLKPKLVYRMWGNHKLQNMFDQNSDETIGEAWIASAYKGNESIVVGSDLNFKQYFEENKEFFDNYEYDKYPLLTKVISTTNDLSIQIHPNDNVANKFGQLGKCECWYVMDSDNSYLYTLKDAYKNKKDEVISLVKNNEIMKCLQKQNVTKGDFVFIPSKTIHAIGKNNLIFELQQSSDLTYRIYDFDRVDPINNKKRELHIDNTIEVLNDNELLESTFREKVNDNLELLTKNKHFTLYKISNKNISNYSFKEARWIQIYVLSGHGKVNDFEIKTNDSIILRHGINDLQIEGDVELMLSYIERKS